MKQVDYIVVGCGLAGIAFSERLRSNTKSFVVFDNNSQTSSMVAGGLYNPVILKRFTPVWKSKEQLEIAIPSYQKIETLLETTLDYSLPVYRLFNSIEEQNNWFAASDKTGLTAYLSPQLIKNTNEAIKAPFGFGEVLHTGRVDTKKLLEYYKAYLIANDLFVEHTFDYDAIKFEDNLIYYHGYCAKQLVFAEGFGLKNNPFFNKLPLNGTKGQLLTIHAPKLKIDYVLKSSVFIIPLGADRYRVGATYEWDDKTNSITKEAREELLTKLKTFLKCDFTLLNQSAGVRPTVSDRRPLVGSHAVYKNVHVLNGLGSRGVMIAPYIARQLFNTIENAMPLDDDIAISRFK